MERRTFKFYAKRSEHCNNNNNNNNIQKQEEKSNNLQKSVSSFQPLKDNTNIRNKKVLGVSGGADQESGSDQSKFAANTTTSDSHVAITTNFSKTATNNFSVNTTDSRQIPSTSSTTTERPLKCLETLAQKAGITFDEKYEVASTLLTLEKSQSPAQVAAPSAVPLQISPEQLQQIQQIQHLQQQFTAIQVKQEFPNQNQMANTNTMTAELKHQLEHNQGQVQQMQVIEGPPASPHQTPNSTAMANSQQHSTTTINTMSPLQALPAGQVPADWSHGRLQLLQPSISNQGYLQHLYPQVLMSGNILPSGLGQQPIQVIAASKPFQGGQMQQMLTATAQGKPMISSTAGGFSGTYTLPTMPSSQSQTLLFSPVSVISSQPQTQQQSMLPTMQATSGNKGQHQDGQKNMQGQKVLQKVASNTSVANAQAINAANAANQQSSQQCVQVSQAMPTAQIISPLQQAGSQPMQITAPWVQSIPQFWANGIQPQTLLAPNSIIIRGTQPDGTQGMFMQAPTHQTIQTQQNNQTLTLPCNVTQATAAKPRPQIETLAPKQQPRAPPILPQSGQPIRPASSVSTQTAQNQNLLNQKQNKLRNKQQAVRPALPSIKNDASNQTKTATIAQVQQQQQQQTMHQVMTSAGGNKMVVMSTTGTPITIQGTQVQSQNDKQQIQLQQIKQQQQQAIMQQQQFLMQQTSNPQILHHQIAQQIQLQQHPQQQQTQISHQGSLTQGPHGTYITQQQQQHQIQNQLMQQHHHQQQQQQIQQSQLQAQQQAQRDQPGIIHHIVVQQQQQQQQQQLSQISAVPITSAATTPSLQHINLQAKQLNLGQTIERPTNVTVAQSQCVSSVQQSAPMLAQTAQTLVSLANSQSAITVTMTSPSTQVSVQPQSSASLISTASGTLTNSAPSNSSSIVVSTAAGTIDAKLADTPVQAAGTPMETDTALGDTLKDTSGNCLQPSVDGVAIATAVNNCNSKIDAKTNESASSLQAQVNAGLSEHNETASSSSIPEDKKMDEMSKTQLMSEENSQKLMSSSQKGLNSSVKSEKGLPKAMIKPNVLTHVIEGFVIQEANEPFAVTRQRYTDKEDEPPKKRIALEDTVNSNSIHADTVVCENCGKHELKSKLKKKRFCSLACARAPKSLDHNSEGISNAEDASSQSAESGDTSQVIPDKMQELAGMTKPANGSCAEDLPLMVHWTVSDVCEFIKNLPGCSDYADDFAMQEIDGQALLLLKENHLVNAMGMKLGPALKIVAKVESMKEGSGIEKEQQ